MVAGANTNSRPGPSSQKRKKHVKPAVKTLVDLRHAARKTDLIRNSYASEESDSDGTPPPSILVALARAGKKLKDKEKGKGRVQGKANKPCSKFNRYADIIELSDSESSSDHRPKKRAKTSGHGKQDDVIDLCSDEDKHLGVASTRDDVLVLSSDDEQITAPPESSPPLSSSPERGKKVNPAKSQLGSTPLLPRPPRPVHILLEDENPLQQSPSSITLVHGSSERAGKRKRLTQQDFIAAFNSSRTTSCPFLSSSPTSHFGSRVYTQKKYNIKYSNECVSSPLLTQTLFSSTIATMKTPTSQKQHSVLRIKSTTTNLSSACSDTKLQPTDDRGSSSQVIAEALLTTNSETGESTKSESISEPQAHDAMKIDSKVQGKPSNPILHPLHPRGCLRQFP